VAGDAPFDAVLDPQGETVVGRSHVGEECVAADGGNLEHPQHRAHSRLHEVRKVRVPHVLEPGRVGTAGHVLHLGVVDHVRNSGMHQYFAEPAGERHVLFGRDVLIAEEQHFPVQQRSTEKADLLIGQVVREIGALDQSPDRR